MCDDETECSADDVEARKDAALLSLLVARFAFRILDRQRRAELEADPAAAPVPYGEE